MKRENLFNIHFYLSSFFTPFLLLMAITGTFYLFGEKGSISKTLIQETITFNKETSKKEQISQLLKKVDKDYRFEYIKDRGSSIQTRPTTREYFNFVEQSEGFFSLYKINPSFLKRIIEVHKGHGPGSLKILQKILGICLIVIIISGFLMSMRIQKRAKPFLISMGLGTLVLSLLFFL